MSNLEISLEGTASVKFRQKFWFIKWDKTFSTPVKEKFNVDLDTLDKNINPYGNKNTPFINILQDGNPTRISYINTAQEKFIEIT
jgi:hypothetical protein